MWLSRKLENWRVLSILKKSPIRFSDWQSVRQLPCIKYLSPIEKARLRVLTSVLLYQKVFVGAQALNVDKQMKLLIAAQACVPVLRIGLNYYSGFTQVIVYPAAFWVERNEQDETGVVHQRKSLLAGEAWSHGPVILSWQDIERDLNSDDGHNVVIHEFSHKIDMLNQGANGVPPLSGNINAIKWGKVFRQAYHRLLERLNHHHKTCIDPYAGTSPAEYFAVASESFFTNPQHLYQCNQKVYIQLMKFYRQDPAKKNLFNSDAD